MLRSATALIVMALAVSWAGVPHDTALRQHMVPVRMAGGHVLYVSQFEVTVSEWARCAEEQACSPGPEVHANARRKPMTGVSWFDVQDYLAWANRHSRIRLRLPDAEEWRWLDRSLKKPEEAPLFTDPRLAWAAEYGREPTPGGPVRPSGSFSTTPDGISDLDGNVWEWTSTCASPGYEGKDLAKCPAFFAEGAHEAQMSVFIRDPAAGGCATGTPPTYLGFRLVADVEPPRDPS